METARRISEKAHPFFAFRSLLTASLVALMSPAFASSAEHPLPDPTDPIERLYGHKRLTFETGEPALTVRIMEGKHAITIVSKGSARIEALSASVSSRHPLPQSSTRVSPPLTSIDVPAGSTWIFRLKRGIPAEQRHFVHVGAFRIEDRQGLETALNHWKRRGFQVRVERIGSRYGLSGRVIDTRRDLLLLGPPQSLEFAQALQRSIQTAHGIATQLHPVLEQRPRGEIEIVDGSGRVRLVADTIATFVPRTDEPTFVRQVEFGVGYVFHNHQDRFFRGELITAIDAAGTLALVNRLELEAYLRGIVPSEIFASAHPEALKAQAVTARGEVLAKIGARHLTDPYLLCAEQHCQVYSGKTGEAASTDKAIADTRGELLFSAEGKLVNSTYSAVCGGHTENNETVWSDLPDPSLRGRPDLPTSEARLHQKLDTHDVLHAFLSEEPKAYCATASFATPSKYRWEKRFTRDEMNMLTADLGIGPIVALTFSERGPSGRASVLTLSGEQGACQIRGELNIRRRFQNLNSTMAEIEAPSEPQPDWIFRGGGWGHGVGMCQVGAIGRAEAGQNYRDILRHYFNGATPWQIYGVPPHGL